MPWILRLSLLKEVAKPAVDDDPDETEDETTARHECRYEEDMRQMSIFQLAGWMQRQLALSQISGACTVTACLVLNSTQALRLRIELTSETESG